jgi:hypothetical protein
MAAPENCKIQWSITGSVMLNLYATDEAESARLLTAAEAQIAAARELSAQITGQRAHDVAVNTVVTTLPGATVVPAPVAAPAPVVPTAPAPVAAPPVQATAAPMCGHGMPAKYIAGGIAKQSGKPYPAFYACALDRDNQCKFRQTA